MRDQSDLKTLRVLIVGGRSHTVQLLRQALHMLGIRQVTSVARPGDAVELLRIHNFAAVFCDENLADSDAGSQSFVIAARRTTGLLNPMIPIFLVCGRPRKRDIEAARDRGFTDVLARPLSAATVKRKLRAALNRPRPFIVASEFFGPDRRTAARAWKGRDRRMRQPRKVKLAAGLEAESTPE